MVSLSQARPARWHCRRRATNETMDPAGASANARRAVLQRARRRPAVAPRSREGPGLATENRSQISSNRPRGKPDGVLGLTCAPRNPQPIRRHCWEADDGHAFECGDHEVVPDAGRDAAADDGAKPSTRVIGFSDSG
jgi:hypothetical protein